MQKCYDDKELSVSKGNFERPEKITIAVDCWKKPEVDSTVIDEPDMGEFGL
jgi:penicillin-binding protein 1A